MARPIALLKEVDRQLSLHVYQDFVAASVYNFGSMVLVN